VARSSRPRPAKPYRSWAWLPGQGPAAADRERGTSAVCGVAQDIRSLGRMAFVVLRKGMSSVQCVIAAGAGGSAQMVAFSKSLTRESDPWSTSRAPSPSPRSPTYPPPIRFDLLLAPIPFEFGFIHA